VNCQKPTENGKPCCLPVGHPNKCDSNAQPAPVMTKAGYEAQQLVDSYQRAKPILAQNPNCEKCHGRAYHELPEPDSLGRVVEHSRCAKCSGYLFVPITERTSYATKRDKPIPNAPRSIPKTHSSKLETPDLTAARLAETARRDAGKRKPKPAPRNYMAEAYAQAARDVNAMLNWNGY
jgi:hypothetical protein